MEDEVEEEMQDFEQFQPGSDQISKLIESINISINANTILQNEIEEYILSYELELTRLKQAEEKRLILVHFFTPNIEYYKRSRVPVFPALPPYSYNEPIHNDNDSLYFTSTRRAITAHAVPISIADVIFNSYKFTKGETNKLDQIVKEYKFELNEGFWKRNSTLFVKKTARDLENRFLLNPNNSKIKDDELDKIERYWGLIQNGGDLGSLDEIVGDEENSPIENCECEKSDTVSLVEIDRTDEINKLLHEASDLSKTQSQAGPFNNNGIFRADAGEIGGVFPNFTNHAVLQQNHISGVENNNIDQSYESDLEETQRDHIRYNPSITGFVDHSIKPEWQQIATKVGV
jgi:hypothetical protein